MEKEKKCLKHLLTDSESFQQNLHIHSSTVFFFFELNIASIFLNFHILRFFMNFKLIFSLKVNNNKYKKTVGVWKHGYCQLRQNYYSITSSIYQINLIKQKLTTNNLLNSCNSYELSKIYTSWTKITLYLAENISLAIIPTKYSLTCQINLFTAN